MKIFLATSNQHKIEEVKSIVPEINWLTVNDFPELKDFNPIEDGHSFAENAEIKALAFAEKVGMLTIAEDSGLVVTSLNGEPGIYSARWVTGTDSDRNRALLAKLANESDRSAKYVATLCLFDPKTNITNFFVGEVHGEIARELAGDKGFGYDPVFIPVGYTETFAQLGTEVKHQLSHRKNALTKFLIWLKN
ncbi:MAG: RdgB/HAM1 family non-canonical purine NTP pyrophosphatase [Candidatus Pacebacteria bacterium]|nr:RdgB/HAM1 family non-canonical purine NTP pyrophosphatase [Candidatus Paceibacterota bacterium]